VPSAARSKSAATRRAEREKFKAAVAKRVRELRVNQEANLQIGARDGLRFSLPKAGRTLADDLDTPPRESPFSIDGLHPAGGNSLLIAQYKTGKTTLLLNLMKSLADGEPFLDRFAVAKLDGRVAFWNYELDEDMFRTWARELAIAQPENVAEPLHLRGQRFPIWLPDVRDKAVRWLQDNEVSFLLIDPAARAMRGLVDNENDNGQIAAFTDALDELKSLSGVQDLVLATHMGRAQYAEGGEQARGATRLEDWMDAGWYLRKEPGEHGTRTLRATGRDVSVEAIDLRWNAATRVLAHTGQTREARRHIDGIQEVVHALARLESSGIYPAITGQLVAAMTGDKNGRDRLVKAAETSGYIARDKKGKALVCSLTDAGRELVKGRVKAKRSKSVAR
jgi:RecA-family ATPase